MKGADTMARGDFLRGLSEGIFSSLNEQRQEQQARDDETKLRTIQTLAGLADRIEPEGLPLLLGHVWDTMGIKPKGKGGGLRGFLDAFSGMPNRSVEDQLGTKLNEISRQFVGPETARRARAGGDMARLFQLQTPEQEANQTNRLQAERDLQRKMIFRDPRTEKLEDLRTQFGLKLTQQESMLEDRERLIRQRQAEDDERNFQNAWKINQQKADLKAMGDVFKRAAVLARKDGLPAPSPNHLQKAAEEISTEQNLNVDLLKARIGLTEARIPLVEAQTKRAQRPPKAQRAGSDTAMGKAIEAFEGLKQSLIDSEARGDAAMSARLRQRLNSMAVTLAAKYPQLEVGGLASGWPYAKKRGQSSTSPPTIETVETLPGGIRLTTPGPTLNEHQRSIFNDIRREQPNAPDAQIFDYMRKKGWLQ
jgi:hypothetical protein